MVIKKARCLAYGTIKDEKKVITNMIYRHKLSCQYLSNQRYDNFSVYELVCDNRALISEIFNVLPFITCITFRLWFMGSYNLYDNILQQFSNTIIE